MWNSIKKILDKQGGTCIIVEDGKPKFVVTAFDEFQQLLEGEGALDRPASSLSEQQLLEKINQDIANWRLAQAEDEAQEVLAEDVADGGIRIEDLPI